MNDNIEFKESARTEAGKTFLQYSFIATLLYLAIELIISFDSNKNDPGAESFRQMAQWFIAVFLLIILIRYFYYVIKGGQWYIYVDKEKIIVETPSKAEGHSFHLKLKDIDFLRKKRGHDDGANYRYYIYSENKEYWFNCNAGFKEEDAIKEILKHRKIDLR